MVVINSLIGIQGKHEPRRSTTLPEHIPVSAQFSSYHPPPTPSLFFSSLSPSLSSSSSSLSSSSYDDADDVRKDSVKSAGQLKGRNDGTEYPTPQGVTGYSLTFPALCGERLVIIIIIITMVLLTVSMKAVLKKPELF